MDVHATTSGHPAAGPDGRVRPCGRIPSPRRIRASGAEAPRDVALECARRISPAVRVDPLDRTLGRPGGLRPFIAQLTDAAERQAPTCKPCGYSLPCLVSRSFEDRTDRPILGMQRHLLPERVARPWVARLQRLVSPGPGPAAGERQATSTTHGGLDDDDAVQDAVVRMSRRMAPGQPVLRAVR